MHIAGSNIVLFSLGFRSGGADVTEVLQILSVGTSVVIVPE